MPSASKREVLALLFAMTFPSLMSWIDFWVLPGTGTDHNSPLAIVYGLGKLLQFTFPVIYIWWVAPQEIRTSRPHLHGMLLGACLALVFAIGMFGIYFLVLKQTNLFAEAPAKLAELLAKLHGNTAVVYIAIAIFLSVFHSLLEEYYWRWFVFGRLERMMRLPAAMAISSVAFMAHHVFILAYYFPNHFWIAALPFSLCVALAGAGWAWLYHRYQSLYAPWVSHLLADAAIMVIGFDMVSKTWG